MIIFLNILFVCFIIKLILISLEYNNNNIQDDKKEIKELYNFIGNGLPYNSINFKATEIDNEPAKVEIVNGKFNASRIKE